VRVRVRVAVATARGLTGARATIHTHTVHIRDTVATTYITTHPSTHVDIAHASAVANTGTTAGVDAVEGDHVLLHASVGEERVEGAHAAEGGLRLAVAAGRSTHQDPRARQSALWKVEHIHMV